MKGRRQLTNNTWLRRLLSAVLPLALVLGIASVVGIFARSSQPMFQPVSHRLPAPWAREAHSDPGVEDLGRVAPAAADPAVAGLTSGKLTDGTRDSGTYASLAAAFQVARYAVEPIDTSSEHSRGAAFFAANPRQKIRVWFGSDRVEFGSGGRLVKEGGGEPWSLALRLRACGRSGSLVAPYARTIRAEGSRVEIADNVAGVTEWYENGPAGLEQGFEIRKSPEPGSGPVEILMTVEGSLRASQVADQVPSSIQFVTEAGAPIIRYSSLSVHDAAGRNLPARMKARGADVSLLVDDAGAQYPICIDPLFASAEARLTEELGDDDNFGQAVALTTDTALIGAENDSTSAGVAAGCAYIFARKGTAWTQQAKLLPSDGAAFAGFGTSVSLDGGTAVVGRRFGGGAYVFVRSGSEWNQEAKLTAPGDFFGRTVALSGDTALIGSPGGAAAYVFVRNGATWSIEATLTGSGGAGMSQFGRAVALDGNTALVSASPDGFPAAQPGSVFVFTRTGHEWQQTGKMNASDASAGDGFGASVALSGDIALAGADVRGAAYVFAWSTAGWVEQAKLTASAGTRFGSAVALSGTTAVVGAPADFVDGTESGSAYVFVGNGPSWSQQARLSANDGAAGDYFGTAVAVSGNTVLVGASGDDTGQGRDSGSAYIFAWGVSSWQEQAKLSSGDGTADDRFGHAISVNGETALVGACYDATVNGAYAGSAYIFARKGASWVQEARITAADGARGDRFGVAVALDKDTAVIGADSGSKGTGCAYVFIRNGTRWEQQAKLSASDGAIGSFLGCSVSLSGTRALVGTREGEAAYIFASNGTTWVQETKLMASDSTAGDQFGSAVALSGDVALIGAPWSSIGASASGGAYTFVRDGTGWRQHAKLVGSDASDWSGFGSAVAISGETALVGAYGDKASLGGAYVYLRQGNSWLQQGKLTAADGQPGDSFGSSVALDRDIALIGAPGSVLPSGAASGTAYIFSRMGTRWTQQTKLTAGVDSSTGDRFGTSVALEGETALVGASQDDTAGRDAGAVYTFLVGELPEITVQPQSRTVIDGALVSFSVDARGRAPLRWQWRRNGIDIPGAGGTSSTSQFTATYSMPGVHAPDSGIFDVVISNAGGTIVSAAATLQVNSLSRLTQAQPPAPPDASGYIIVKLSPPGIGAGWRFVGEKEWRAPDVPVGGLTSADREIEFRPVPGYLQPLREPVAIVSGGPAEEIEREYYQTPSGSTGQLSFILKPASLTSPLLAVEQRAQWRLLGAADAAWQDSDALLAGLTPGTYLVECKPVAGRSTPPPIPVTVEEGKTIVGGATYFLADTQTGDSPRVLPFDDVASGAAAGLPYSFVGQIQSDAGLASGFVVSERVVATAGHVVWDDSTLSAAVGLQWFFQRHRGTYEPAAQIPRGFYMFAGYAAQRQAEGTPGESSPASQNMDAAALYFVDGAAGRGGYSGFVASDSAENEWLTSSRDKMLVGYPTYGIPAAHQGQMHATIPANIHFSRSLGFTYTTTAITASGGASGGPLCVRSDDGLFYPAGIYLGGTAQTAIRAIDSQVIDLFDRARVSGEGGENHVDLGITHTDAPAIGGVLPWASLQVNLSPKGAVDAGARWKFGLAGKERLSGEKRSYLSPGRYIVFFTPVPGFVTPQPREMALVGKQAVVLSQPYTQVSPPVVTSASAKSGRRGEPFAYQVEATGTGLSFSLVGELPAGLSFDAATGRVSGIPAESGKFLVAVRASNEVGSDSLPFTVRIAPVLENQVAVVSASQPLNYPILTKEFVLRYGTSGRELPEGLVLDPVTGLLRGSVSEAGVFPIPISITNDGGTSEATLTLSVRPKGELSGRVSQPFAPVFVVEPGATGGRLTASNLPPGLFLDTEAGTIAGTPTSSGVFNVTVSRSDESGTTNGVIRIVVDAVLRVTVGGTGSGTNPA